jgi:hypothetical protein
MTNSEGSRIADDLQLIRLLSLNTESMKLSSFRFECIYRTELIFAS